MTSKYCMIHSLKNIQEKLACCWLQSYIGSCFRMSFKYSFVRIFCEQSIVTVLFVWVHMLTKIKHIGIINRYYLWSHGTCKQLPWNLILATKPLVICKRHNFVPVLFLAYCWHMMKLNIRTQLFEIKSASFELVCLILYSLSL